MAATGQKVKLHLSCHFMEFVYDDPEFKSLIKNVIGQSPFAKTLREGTANGQIDLGYVHPLAIAASGTSVLDIRGAISDLDGTAITFAEVVGWLFVNTTETAGVDFSVGPNSANGFTGFYVDATDRIKVYSALAIDDPGIGFLYAPRGVTAPEGAGNGDSMLFTNLSTSTQVTGFAIVFGRSA